MPIYEYRCAACGHELEALQKLSDAALTTCPSCHKSELKKLLSAAGFQLKGSGWYVTDFRNSGGKPPVKEKPAGGDAVDGNGSAAAPASGSGATGDAAKGETKATDGTTAGTTNESKPAAATPSTTKSDA